MALQVVSLRWDLSGAHELRSQMLTRPELVLSRGGPCGTA